MESDPFGSEAESLFAELVARGDEGLEARLEASCRAHPELARALREVHAGWRLAERARSAVGLGASVVDVHGLDDASRARAPAPRATAPEPRERLASLVERARRGLRLELGRELGRGNMGQVLEARDPDLGRTLALKRIRADRLPPKEAGEDGLRAHLLHRFLAEAQVTAQLEHPGIVPVHDIGVDERGEPFYTMARIEGEDLGRVLEKARAGADGWTVPRAVELLVRVAETLAYAHERGVVHRDVKPANVRVGRLGQVYVTDWGLARVLDGSIGTPVPVATDRTRAIAQGSPLATLEGLVPGTPAYMAPEQAAGRAEEVGPRTDVYALGALLYELLAGCAPYAREGGESAEDVRRRVRNEPPPPLARVAPDAPPELVATAEKAMAREPAARYASALELAADLRAFLEGRVVRAHRTGPWVELVKWTRRNRLAAAALGAALLLVIGGTTSFALLSRQSAQRARKLALFSDHERIVLLRARADELWPIRAELVSRYRAWIEEAEELLSRRELHEAAVEDETLAVEDRARIAGILAGLDTLSDERVGLLDGVSPEFGWGVRRRLQEAEAKRRRLAAFPDDPRWRDTLRAVSADPAFPGFLLAPHVDLRPLGPDPDSGLHEFAHLPTGTPASRDREGRLHVSEETGLVFVLVPGGEVAIGAQSITPGALHFDALAHANESPPQHVHLAPFLVSKYEMTRSQWLRWTGADPATPEYGEEPEAPGLHPVQSISFEECVHWLGRLGVGLPSEAQWEHAARAGTSSPWWFGDDPLAHPATINVGDAALARSGVRSPGLETRLDDGYAGSAPVDSLAPNPFGLHHVLGNVWEWCADVASSYEIPARPGDGLRVPPDPARPQSILRVARGGSFAFHPGYARASVRDLRLPRLVAPTHGVRPVIAPLP